MKDWITAFLVGSISLALIACGWRLIFAGRPIAAFVCVALGVCAIPLFVRILPKDETEKDLTD